MQVRCPHCHNPVEVLDDSSFKDIVCSSCGSAFSLVGGSDATETARHAARTIGQFELIEQLGVGAFGTVWKANDRQLDRLVAIKIPRKGQLSDAETEQFLREARAAAQLRHANIVSVHEVGKSDDSVYIVADYVEGADLKEWLRGQALPPKEAAELCAKIAEALHHAHEQGVIHRDLKPGNIMMDQDGQPHIMDFGLAKRESGEITMTVEGAVLGTPAYMSPEQAKGKGHEADRRSDVYSLGTMLFEMLTGELPFRGEKRMLIVSILTEEPPKLRRLNPRVSTDLETICLKCLEKEPERRYTTAKRFADDLRRYLIGEPISVRPVGSVEYAWRWSRRNPALAGLLAASLVGLMLSASIIVGYGYQKRLASANSQLGDTNDQLRSTNEKLLEAQQRLDRVLYCQHVSQALSAWHDGEFAGSRRLLDDCPAHERHWEWHYVDGLFHRGVTTLKGHKHWVNTIEFSPDGTQLASTSREDVKIWDVETWKEPFMLSGALPPVAFSPDGGWVASEADDHSVVIWNATSGRRIRTLRSHSSDVSGIVFSPDGTHLATSSSDGAVVVWDTRKGELTWTLKGSARLAFNGHQLAVPADNDIVRVLDIQTGKELFTLSGSNTIFSPDGTLVAVSSRRQGLRICDAGTGHDVHTMKGQYREDSVKFTNNGKWFVTNNIDGTITVWDVATWEEVRTITTNDRAGQRDVSRDGRLVVGRSAHGATVWDIEAGEATAVLKGHADVIQRMRFSSDARQVVSASRDQTIKVWDLSVSREPLTLVKEPAAIWSLAISANGQLLASGSENGSIRVWDLGTGQEQLALNGHEGAVLTVAFSPDGRRIVSNSGDYTIRIWDARNGDQLRVIWTEYPGPSDFPGRSHALASMSGSVSFSPDGQRIVGPAGRNLLKVWDSASGEEVLTLVEHTDRLMCAAFDLSGRRIASGQQLGNFLPSAVWEPADPILILWDAETGEKLTILKGHAHNITSVAFNPDGKRVATGSFDTTVKLWDLRTTEEQHTLYAETFVNSVAFSPDGKRIVAATRGGRIKVWDTDSGQLALTLREDGASVLAVAFTPDGRKLVSSNADGAIKIWDAGTAEFVGRVN